MTPSAVVVDDDETIREIVSMALEPGFETVSFPNGQACWEYFEAHETTRPDLIVLDVMMPELNGIRLLEKIRDEDRFDDSIVVMLSSRGTADDVTKGLTAGADEYITKPFAPKVLLARIEKAMA